MLILISPLFAPQLLAFPHKTETEIGTVWSVEPLDEAMLDRAVSDARLRVETSPLASENETRPIFITDGGWRWLYLANASHSAFAVTRPINDAVIVNRIDPGTGVVTLTDSRIGNQRSLGGILAHEFTHGLIRREYGVVAASRFPEWKVEGYCDFVAGESSLTAEEAAQLEAAGTSHPALAYFYGRQRVAALLEQNEGSVDKLFTSD